MRSAVDQGWPDRSSRSRTWGALSPIAAAYQMRPISSSTVVTGIVRPCTSRRQTVPGAMRATASAVIFLSLHRPSVFIGMPGAQGLPDPMGDGEELGRVADIEAAPARQVALDHLHDAPGPRAHDDDLAGE